MADFSLAARKDESLLLRMGLAAGGNFKGMPEQGRDGCEAFLCTSFAAGEIDDKRGVSEAGNSAREPRKWIALGAMETYGFSESGRFALNDAVRCLGGAIARSEAGATDGDDQGGVLGTEFFKLVGNCIFVVGQQAGPGFGFRPKLLEKRDNGRASGVDLQTLGATVGDGEDAEQHREIVGGRGWERQGLRD